MDNFSTATTTSELERQRPDSCPKRTCVQFPPVDVAEEGVGPELITAAVPEPEPLVHLSDQQTLADGAGLLAELLRVRHRVVQDPIFQHLVLHLKKNRQT